MHLPPRASELTPCVLAAFSSGFDLVAFAFAGVLGRGLEMRHYVRNHYMYVHDHGLYQLLSHAIRRPCKSVQLLQSMYHVRE